MQKKEIYSFISSKIPYTRFMSICVTFVVLILFPGTIHSQSLDSLTGKISSSEASAIGIENKLDSIQFSAAKEYYSLKDTYDSAVTRADDQINRLQRNIDSLRNLQLHTDRFAHKLDSIKRLKDEKIKFITSRIDTLKSRINKKIESLDFPPALREKASELTLLMDKLDITLPKADLPASFQQNLNIGMPNLTTALNGQNISNIDISNGVNPLNGQALQEVTNMKLPSTDMGSLGDQVLQYEGQTARLPTDMDNVAKFAEDRASNISAVSDVQKELGHVADLTDVAGTLQDQEQLKKLLTQEAQKQAVDHFAGKEEQLKKAMESVSKYKQKFPTISSLNDLPKKRPNEMKGKPWIERIVPGIGLQVQKKGDDLLVDFNSYAAYRFTGRISAGIGWNQRIAVNVDNKVFNPDARIYGPRVFGEFKWWRGFSPRAEVELMNTNVPPLTRTQALDPFHREWVWGAFVGIKKEYRFFKNIKGTASIMMRLFNPDHKSPYADVVNARFGFEFPMKKKPVVAN